MSKSGSTKAKRQAPSELLLDWATGCRLDERG